MINKFLIKAVMDSIIIRKLPIPFIAGGYARDIHFGRKPKDVDVFVPLGPYVTDAEVYLDMQELADKFSRNGHRVEIHRAYGIGGNSCDFDERLYGVLKIDDIDVLFSRSSTIPEVMESFDSNLSQAYITPASETVRWYRSEPTEVYTLKDIPMKRLLRLNTVAAELGLQFEMRHEVQR